MLTFEYIWVFALLPLPWFIRAIVPARKIHPVAVRVPFGTRLEQALGQRPDEASSDSSGRSLIVQSLVWGLVLTSVARPQWIEPPITKEQPTRDLLLLVDLSGSMDQEDFQNAAGNTVDRLTAVKEVLSDFLIKREGDRVGLVVFGDAAYLQAPFSTDLELTATLLDECQVGMAGPRTALGDAIGLGVTLFDESDVPAKTIIALTDGNDTKSRVPPVEAARVAKQRGVRIHTIAIGDPTTAGEDKLDEQTLRDVASETGGAYFFAADRTALEGIYDELDRVETRDVQTVSHRPRRDIFYLPLTAALMISMASQAFTALKRGSDISPNAVSDCPLRVNPLTGKLEVTP